MAEVKVGLKGGLYKRPSEGQDDAVEWRPRGNQAGAPCLSCRNSPMSGRESGGVGVGQKAMARTWASVLCGEP